jgi:hypothetical protein
MNSYIRLYGVLLESHVDWSAHDEEEIPTEKLTSRKRGGKRPEPPFWGKRETAKAIKKRIKRNIRRGLKRADEQP